MAPRPSRAALLALAALLAMGAPAVRAKPGKSGGFGGGSFGSGGSFGGGSFGKPAMGTPVRTGGTAMGYPAAGGGAGSFRPAAGQALPTMPVAAKPVGAAAAGAGVGGAAGMGAGMMGGGMRRSSSIMPFAMGAFAGTAAYALLSRDPSARCDGFRVNCYQRLCEQAAANCPGGAAGGLQPARCPEARFTECWETKDRSFVCVGVSRPSASRNMEAFCRDASLANGTDARSAGAGAGSFSGKAGPNGVELVPAGTPSVGGAGARRAAGAGAALAAGAAALALLL